MSFLPPQPPDLERPEAVVAPAPRWQPPSGAAPPAGPAGVPVPAAGRKTNNHAVWGLVLAACGVGLLVFTAGFAAPLSLPACISGWILGVKGKRRVDRGDPVGDRPMAVTAQITGIVGVVLCLLAIAFWVLLIALGDWNYSFESDPFFPQEDPGGRLD